MDISAVIFDLDGTLVNTEQVTKHVLKELLGKYGKVQDPEKEKRRLGMTFKESAVSIVNDYDLPLTPEEYMLEIIPLYQGKWLLAKALPGANRLMFHLQKHGIPFALASNSLRKNIDGKIAHHTGWIERFAVILGSDQVKSGKPSPDMYISGGCKRMGVDPFHSLVIEDSVVGVTAGKAAGMKVVAVPSLQTDSDSYSIADSILHSLLEFEPEQWGLAQFDDWINDALPIEPIHLFGAFSKEIFYHHSDSELLLPDQVWGLYIGWVKFENSTLCKSVISIGWCHSCCGGSKRRIRTCILNEIDDGKDNKKTQLVITCYLRRSITVGDGVQSIDIVDEDKWNGETALKLPEFSHKLCKSFQCDC